jgi:hypothetical protein
MDEFVRTGKAKNKTRASMNLATPRLRQRAAFLVIGLALLNVAGVLVGLGLSVLLTAISRKQKAPPFYWRGFTTLALTVKG